MKMAWLFGDVQLDTPTPVRRLASKAAARWLFTLLSATLCFLGYTYYYHAIPSTTTDTAAISSGGSLRHRPAWIDTPPTFDSSHGPGAGIGAITASLDRPIALHPLLAKAVTSFLARPALDHEQARVQNEAACPRAQLDSQVNADQLRDERPKWLAVDAARIVAMRRAAVDWLEERSAREGEGALIGPGFGREDGTAVQKGSRGVVFAAGNHRTVEKVLVCIEEMRRLGWPGGAGIEVWHFEGELEDEKLRGQLEELGARIRMVSTKKTPGQWKNFELKAESILRSSFDEVLYLDSDNFPLSDISKLFDAALFRDPQGGNAVFWPDLNRDHPDNAIHRLLGIPCHDAWELDSGQVLIAKSGNGGLNLAALYLAQHMAEIDEGRYWFSGGDKDTFRYAFLALGLPYTPAPRWLSLLGSMDSRGTNVFFCGAAMLQYGLEPASPARHDRADPGHPEPLFVHANLLKHMAGARPGKIFTQMRRLSPAQDDVQVDWPLGTALHGVVGGARSIAGRGLCGDIWAFQDSTMVETVETKDVYGGLMEKFEAEYFEYKGTRPGVW